MKPGQETKNTSRYAYMVISNREVKRVMVQSEFGGIYTVRFENGGGTKVKSHRLYPSAEAANAAIAAAKKPVRGYRMPHT